MSKQSYNSAVEQPIAKIALQEKLEQISISLSKSKNEQNIDNNNNDNNQDLALEASKIEKQILQIEIIEEFLKQTSASQMTHHGLGWLRKNLKNRRVYVLFRHNHFSVLLKFMGF